MGKIKKILENELVGGTQSTDVYPITSTKAVYDENNERLDNILGGLRDKIGIFKNAGYLYAGVATPNTDPDTPKANVFYIANGKGTYNNFGGIGVTEDEVVFLYWDSSWHKVSTGIASQWKLTELKEKVDALALGTFYGYFPDSSSLPVDVTTPGYAYVGLDNPYKIWNFNGESWSDSGTSIDMNDADEEDITRNADGKLQFKDRTYGDGMGYVILRKNKSFSEQVTKENTIYEIRYDFILENDITIPTNCILKFNGGSISGNNTIDLNYCSCVGNISFKNIKINNFKGSITAKQLGLLQGDNIANIIGTGWKDCDVDLENIALVQRVGYIQFSGNYCHIIRWNINRINSKETESTSSNLAEARLIFANIPNLIIEYCTFDGTGSNINFVGGNFYFSFNGINIQNCPNAIVRYNIIKNFPASCGIFAEVSDNISIIDNVVKNCSIYVTPVDDTNGDGIYVRTTKNAIIKNNIVDIDDNIQIGRCGICHEYYASGIIENNTISGYDRGIHIELCYDYNTVRNNHVTRCHSAIMLWGNSDYKNTGNIAHIIVENNYLSNKGMVKSSINSKNYTPLTYGRAIINLLNDAGDSHEENKRTEFINNTIESFDTGDFNNYCRIETDYSGKWVNNKFVRNGSHTPKFHVNHYHLTYLNHLYFCDNDFEGTFQSQDNSYVKMHNNIIKQFAVTFFSILNFDSNKDYTTQISIQNNTYQMLAESQYTGGATAIFSGFGGIFKNNVWGLGTAHYSLFDEKNIAKGSVIDNNVFQMTHAYEGITKRIWYGRSASEVSPNLTPGKNLLVDLRDGSNTAIIVDNPQYSA